VGTFRCLEGKGTIMSDLMMMCDFPRLFYVYSFHKGFAFGVTNILIQHFLDTHQNLLPRP
jgi:hypothetical protein